MSQNNVSSPYDLNANNQSTKNELVEEVSSEKEKTISPYDLNSHGGLIGLVNRNKKSIKKKRVSSNPYDLQSHGGLPGLLKRHRGYK